MSQLTQYKTVNKYVFTRRQDAECDAMFRLQAGSEFQAALYVI